MSNRSDTRASREEEIAFLVLERVLGVEIWLADAGSGDSMPDGAWVSSGAVPRCGVVEVTSPPDEKLMREWAIAKRDGRRQSEGGSVPLRWHQLGEICSEMLREPWALGRVSHSFA